MRLPKFNRTWTGTAFVWWYAVLFIICVKIYVNCASERSGVATVPRYRTASMPQIVKRSENPEEFRNLMNAKWLQTTIWVIGGLIIRGLTRRQEQLDPMSPSFQGQKELDDLGQWLDKETDKHHRPLR